MSRYTRRVCIGMLADVSLHIEMFFKENLMTTQLKDAWED